MSEHKFAIHNDTQDCISASWLLTRHRCLWKRLIITLAVVWLGYTALYVVPDAMNYGWHTDWVLSGASTAAAWTCLLAGVITACMTFKIHFHVRRLVKKLDKLAPTSDFSFDAEVFKSSNPVATTSLAWPKFELWLENERVLLLIVMERSYFILPKSQVPPETLDALRNHLIAAQVPNR